MDTGHKSSKALRTIGEAAKELGVPTHVLRFWESKFSQIKPQKRRGGHRYYRPQDIETLQQVKTLLHEQGFTIKGAQKYLSQKQATAQTVLPLTPKAKSSASLDAGDTAKLEHVLSELHAVKDLLKQAS